MQKLIVRRPAKSANTSSNFPNCCPVLSKIFDARGVAREAQLQYQLNHLLPPTLLGLERAVDLLVEQIQEQGRILILGDFDADGATSTALSVRCLQAFGLSNVEYLVPNRFEFGYGMTPEIVEIAAQRHPALILTVDNGISSVAGVELAKRMQIKVVITDHHLPGDQLPPADAIVNPNQRGCTFASKAAAGVGVVFYVMMAVRARLRDLGWFAGERKEPNLANVLDLVALGTVADVVPLDFNNRILVAQGLQRMRAGLACPGILALLQIAGRSATALQAADLGFIVGPRLNAAGRLDDMSLGIRCLLSNDPGEALAIAQELDSLNRERRSIEASMQHEAAGILDKMLIDRRGALPDGVCFYQHDWHQGVIGILASRMKDRLHRPVIVFADDGQGQLKGSGRSVPGVHLRDVLDRVAKLKPSLLSKFGGHAMAAGLSLRTADLEVFKLAFAEAVSVQLNGQSLQAVIETDGSLDPEEFDMALAEQLERAGPWGQAFPEPCFDGDFHLLQQKLVGTKHLKLVLAPLGRTDIVMDAIAFNIDPNQWPNPKCTQARVAYKLSVNEFRGNRQLQLVLDYIEPIAVS